MVFILVCSCPPQALEIIFFFENQFLIVAPTLPPSKIAPAVSKIDAKRNACFIVRTFDPTAVPNEFATSFAPTAKASMNANAKATKRIQLVDSSHSSRNSAGDEALCKVVFNCCEINFFRIVEFQKKS